MEAANELGGFAQDAEAFAAEEVSTDGVLAEAELEESEAVAAE